MKLTIYLDILIVVNIVINYFLLKTVSVITSIADDKKRIIFSSVVGSLFSVLIFFELGNTVSLFYKIISICLSAYIAFGFINLRRFVKVIIATVFVNFSFTGIVIYLCKKSRYVYIKNGFYYIGISPVIFVLAVILIYIFISVFEYLFTSNENYKCTIDINGKKIPAFYDTGFNVKDIITHRPILLANSEYIQNLLNMKITPETSGYIPVFFSDLTGEGIFPAIRINEIKIKDKTIKNVLLAVTDKDIFDDVKIIFGKEIKSTIGD